MSSKRRVRRRSCRGKQRYEEEWEAATVAKQMRRQHADNRLGWYKCQFCGGWHVGRRNKETLKWASGMARAQAEMG